MALAVQVESRRLRRSGRRAGLVVVRRGWRRRSRRPAGIRRGGCSAGRRPRGSIRGEGSQQPLQPAHGFLLRPEHAVAVHLAVQASHPGPEDQAGHRPERACRGHRVRWRPRGELGQELGYDSGEAGCAQGRGPAERDDVGHFSSCPELGGAGLHRRPGVAARSRASEPDRRPGEAGGAQVAGPPAGIAAGQGKFGAHAVHGGRDSGHGAVVGLGGPGGEDEGSGD